MKYIPIPTVVDAFRLPGEHEDVPDTFEPWCERVGFEDFASAHFGSMEFKGGDGKWYLAGPGEWIVKTPAGFICMPDHAFQAMFYEDPAP